MRPAGDRHARAVAKSEAQAAIDAASRDLARDAATEAEWQRRVADALASSYLRDDDPRWQSGFDGDAALWREAREFVLDAVPADARHGATLLDVGCATGHLMECLVAWGRARGLELTLYGLELNPDLAAAARRRLPGWAGRIYTGNVSDWVPPHRFTYVRTGLEYVPPGRGSALVAGLLRDVVAPGGRLIVGPVSGADVAAVVEAFAAAGVPEPALVGAADRNGKARHVVWADAGSSHLGLASGTVRLAAADPAWPALFAAERARVLGALGAAGSRPLALEHVGSTAVAGLAAKPILDLMGGRPAGGDLAPYVAALEALGYRHRGEYGIPGRHYFVRDAGRGRRTHHLHLVPHDGAFWREHLAFRDALRADSALRDAYAALKCDLAARFPGDREAYTDGKTAFIRQAVATALAHAPAGASGDR